jgi:NAD(P)-dependent dehydrogenase (short-subunit alcohol dehydrogenase family)
MLCNGKALLRIDGTLSCSPIYFGQGSNIMEIRDATALVTGANRGIGRALVAALLQAGAKTVYAASREPSNLEATLALDLKRVRPVMLDVTNRDQVAALPAHLTDVTLLVNNAAVLHFGGILDVPLDTMVTELDTNFFGKLVMARGFAPVIERNGGGAIVNMLTLVALASMPGLSVYNASKAAAWSMTQSLRASLAGKGVAVPRGVPWCGGHRHACRG